MNNLSKEKKIEMFKKFINSLEQKTEEYYKIDEEFYKDQIEELELNIKLSKTILNIIYELQEENNKLKKQIDLMAEDLKTDYHSKEWIIKYYEEMIK